MRAQIKAKGTRTTNFFFIFVQELIGSKVCFRTNLKLTKFKVSWINMDFFDSI